MMVTSNVSVVRVFTCVNRTPSDDDWDTCCTKFLNSGSRTFGIATHDDYGIAAHVHQRFHVVQLSADIAVRIDQNRLPPSFEGNTFEIVSHCLHGRIHGVQGIADKRSIFACFCCTRCFSSSSTATCSCRGSRTSACGQCAGGGSNAGSIDQITLHVLDFHCFLLLFVS